MPTSFRPYVPEQILLLPPSLTDWLAQGPLAYFVSDTIEALDSSPLRTDVFDGRAAGKHSQEPGVRR